MREIFLLARPPLYIIIVSQNSAAHLGRLFSALKIIINHQRDASAVGPEDADDE